MHFYKHGIVNAMPNIHTVTIERLTHEGRGVAHIDGKATFIEGAVPGESVRCEITHTAARHQDARVLELLTSADTRVIPRCAYFGVCGGCLLQHMSPALQLTHKEAMLLEQLHHFGAVTPGKILPPLTAPVWQYRRKARLSVKYVRAKDKMLVGFRERAGRYITDMTACAILAPPWEHLPGILAELLYTFEHRNAIAQIEIASGDNASAMIVRHLTALSAAEIAALIAFAKTHHLWLYLQPQGLASIHKVYPADAALLTYTLPESQITLFFHPNDFIQVNAGINAAIVHTVLEWLALTPEDRILDLFCGLGNFSIPLAKRVQQVVGVECDTAMIQRAEYNALHNQCAHIQFYTADLFIDNSGAPWLAGTYNKLLIDPPRAGALHMVTHLDMRHIERIVYVSCNPATLARDANVLVEKHGFSLAQVAIADMFPHTAHVESLALFIKSERKKHG